MANTRREVHDFWNGDGTMDRYTVSEVPIDPDQLKGVTSLRPSIFTVHRPDRHPGGYDVEVLVPNVDGQNDQAFEALTDLDTAQRLLEAEVQAYGHDPRA